jgi:uncharacterized protein Smg (DUF494 family)
MTQTIEEQRNILASICLLAKSGHSEAIHYLKKIYSCRVYTYEEIDRLNQIPNLDLTSETLI